MKKYCPCGRFVALIKGGHIRRGTEFVCRECYERLQAADAVARMAREQVQGNSDVNNFLNMFGMKK